jgi:hypothetical protein
VALLEVAYGVGGLAQRVGTVEDRRHREWIDHILYVDRPDGPWVANAEVNYRMPDGTPIWQKYPHSSDHYPITTTVTT